MDYFPGSDQKQLVKEGMHCQVKLGNDLVVTGYVDDWSPAISVRAMKSEPQAAVSAQISLIALLNGQITSSITVMRLI